MAADRAEKTTSGTAVNASPNAGTQPHNGEQKQDDEVQLDQAQRGGEAVETTSAAPSGPPSAHSDRVAMVSYTKDGHPDQSADFEVIRAPRPDAGATEPGESILGGQPQRPATSEAAGAVTPIKRQPGQAEPTEDEQAARDAHPAKGGEPAAKGETGRR